ncbi:hypothetical protein V5H41_28590, partial [Salmonella enterica]
DILCTDKTGTLTQDKIVLENHTDISGKPSEHVLIVKHLDAIQNFGAMDILCTDKTGTLTQDKIVLENHTDISGKPSEHVL